MGNEQSKNVTQSFIYKPQNFKEQRLRQVADEV